MHFKVEAGVAWLRLDRPREGNRITQALAQALCDAIAEIEHDDSVTLAVLTASGSSFCLGTEAAGNWEQRIDWVAAAASLTKPVVAVAPGDAYAEGLELMLACDLRIAAKQARFALPQVVQGRLPIHGGTQRLPRLIGRGRALDLLLSGRSIGAAEAERIGLINRSVPRLRLRAAAREMADGLRAKGPIALRFAKESVLKGADMTLMQGIRLEEDLYALLQTTADRGEGVRAFLAKRKPILKGR